MQLTGVFPVAVGRPKIVANDLYSKLYCRAIEENSVDSEILKMRQKSDPTGQCSAGHYS